MKKDEIRQKILALAKDYAKAAALETSQRTYIPASGKVLDERELENMFDASMDMWLTAGRFNDEFEKRFAECVGARFALTVNSGSSANLVAMSALCSHKLGERRIKKGEEVITVAAGFPTTVNPIVQNGLIPVFVDNELSTYNIDTDKIEGAISPKTRAIFVAHTLGMPFDMEKILDICRRKNLWLIEDSCDALSAEYSGKKVGTMGHIGTFSFYPAHHITMGEGGAVVTSDSKLYRIMMSIRDWGRDCWCPPGKDNTCSNRFKMKLGRLPEGYDHKYIYSHLGYNLKITDWQAAIGLAQLEKLPSFIERRRANAEYLLESLKDLRDVLILPSPPKNSTPSWFGFLISVKPDAGFTKQELVEYLEANAVGTRQLFAGNILRQPMMTESDVNFRVGNSGLLNSSEISDEIYAMLPNADFIMNNTFWIGCYPALNEIELSKVSALIRSFVRKNS